ncbi:MAG: radical SAM protein [Methanomicrobium sp.]|nr:radical SAM protein [Methanomicrobium sp.]
MKCTVCENRCEIAEKKSGKCRMYVNLNGVITEKFPDSYLTLLPITIETIPMVHFQPKSKFFQVSTTGCNFKCQGCISETLTSHADVVSGALKKMPPEKVVQMALDEECSGIVFCLNDPIVSYFTFKGLAEKAKSAGLYVGCSTNGYFTEEALISLIPFLDFANIGLKGSSDERYKECGVNSAEPVFRNIKILHENGVHVEISLMYINGSEDEILSAAKRVAAISSEIPMQVMRFVPFGNAAPGLEPSIKESEEMTERLRTFLDYVYLFNSPGTEYLNTVCPKCGETVIEREFYGPMGCRVANTQGKGTCRCGWKMPFAGGEIKDEQYTEFGMLGGYRTTRAIEMAHAVLVALGVNTDDELGRVLGDIIKEDFIRGLHDRIQGIDSWLNLIEELSKRAGKEENGKRLISHIQERVNMIKKGVKNTEVHPAVYYAMGYPLFALNAGRFESNLVEAAGGRCVNKTIERKGKPGVNISAEELNKMNPEKIFISGFLSSPASDFLNYCRNHNINARAVRSEDVYNVPAGWDFGSPRWILGFMFIANKIHPEIFSFDLQKEQSEFYKKFYGIESRDIIQNRDFSRPAM